MRWLLMLACVCGWAASASAQTAPDPVTTLLLRFEQALNKSDKAELASMFSPDVPPSKIEVYTNSLFMPGAVKTTLRLRDRAPLEGAPPGDGYSLVVEFFIETPGRGRILTAGMDMRRPPEGDLASWRFVSAETLTFVEGLYKLRIDRRPLTDWVRRRRALDASRPISAAEWKAICQATGIAHFPTQADKAGAWVWATLTGCEPWRAPFLSRKVAPAVMRRDLRFIHGGVREALHAHAEAKAASLK